MYRLNVEPGPGGCQARPMRSELDLIQYQSMSPPDSGAESSRSWSVSIQIIVRLDRFNHNSLLAFST